MTGAEAAEKMETSVKIARTAKQALELKFMYEAQSLKSSFFFEFSKWFDIPYRICEIKLG